MTTPAVFPSSNDLHFVNNNDLHFHFSFPSKYKVPTEYYLHPESSHLSKQNQILLELSGWRGSLGPVRQDQL